MLKYTDRKVKRKKGLSGNFQQKEFFWVSFGRFIKKRFSSSSNHSSNISNDSVYSETLTDTMDDLDDIFDNFDGDFDETTIHEAGYDADSEDDY